MELEEIQQLSKPVNGRLRRRTWIAVITVTTVIIGIALWSNHQVSKTAKNYDRRRIVGESLAHEERQVILEKLTKVQKALEGHMGQMMIDTLKAKKLDSLTLENLEQQKK